jgi:hypothetical protein
VEQNSVESITTMKTNYRKIYTVVTGLCCGLLFGCGEQKKPISDNSDNTKSRTVLAASSNSAPQFVSVQFFRGKTDAYSNLGITVVSNGVIVQRGDMERLMREAVSHTNAVRRQQAFQILGAIGDENAARWLCGSITNDLLGTNVPPAQERTMEYALGAIRRMAFRHEIARKFIYQGCTLEFWRARKWRMERDDPHWTEVLSGDCIVALGSLPGEETVVRLQLAKDQATIHTYSAVIDAYYHKAMSERYGADWFSRLVFDGTNDSELFRKWYHESDDGLKIKAWANEIKQKDYEQREARQKTQQ